MTTPALLSENCHVGLQNTLLGYLRSVNTPFWPGGDGLTLDVVVASYPRVAAAGFVPDQAELVCRHPQWTADLRAFFAALHGPGGF